MLDLQYIDLYAELVQVAQKLSDKAYMLSVPTDGRTDLIGRIASALALHAGTIHAEALRLYDEKAASFKPKGWVMENGEFRDMNDEELAQAMIANPLSTDFTTNGTTTDDTSSD